MHTYTNRCGRAHSRRGRRSRPVCDGVSFVIFICMVGIVARQRWGCGGSPLPYRAYSCRCVALLCASGGCVAHTCTCSFFFLYFCRWPRLSWRNLTPRLFFRVPPLAKGKAWILRARCGRSSQSFCLSVHKNVQRDWSQTLLLCLRTVTTNNSQALVRALPYTRKSNQNNPTTDGAQVLTPTSQAAEHGTPTPPTRDGDCYYDDNYVVLIFVTQSVTARPSPWGSSTGSTAGAP